MLDTSNSIRRNSLRNMDLNQIELVVFKHRFRKINVKMEIPTICLCLVVFNKNNSRNIWPIHILFWFFDNHYLWELKFKRSISSFFLSLYHIIIDNLDYFRDTIEIEVQKNENDFYLHTHFIIVLLDELQQRISHSFCCYCYFNKSF